MSWHKVSNILHHVNNPETVKTLIQGVVGLDSTLDFIQTLREVKDLPDAGMLLKLRPEELGEYAPHTLTGLWGLTYALIAHSTTPEKLVNVCRVMIQLFPHSSVPMKEDALNAGLIRCIEIGFSEKVSWIKKVSDNKMYREIVAPRIALIPSLGELPAIMNNSSEPNF